MEVGQGSGSRKSSAKRARTEPEVPDLVFGEHDMNETHVWLDFSGARQPHRNTFLNKLYSLHRQVVCPPKYLDPVFSRLYGVQQDIRRWFAIEVQIEGRMVQSDMWHNVFNNREPSFRELSLEFYSSLKLTKELNKVKNIFEERIVTFMCGGQSRKLSIAEFGYYCGMYSREQLDNSDFRALLKKGLFVKQDIGDGESISQYWTRISGGLDWPLGGSGSVSKIRSVKLRLLHRMIVTFLVHRSTHWDKAYQLDLWLLKLFSEGAPRRFALAPVVVLDRMVNHSDSRLVLGQFITRIYKRMGVFELDVCSDGLSLQVRCEDFTEKELIIAKIVKKTGKNEQPQLLADTGDIGAPPVVVEEPEDEELEDAPPEPPRRRGQGGIQLTEIGAQLQQILEGQQSSRQAFDDYQRRMEQEMTWVGSQHAQNHYYLDYYQPMWDAQYHNREFVRPDPCPVFSPPPIYVPDHRQGGGSFFSRTPAGHMSPRPHDLGGSPRSPVQFGSFHGGSSSMQGGFSAGTSSGWAPWPDTAGPSGADAGGSGSGAEDARAIATHWVDSFFGPPGHPHGYHGQSQ